MTKQARIGLKDLITGIDGETVDPARVLWLLGTLVFLAGEVTTIFKGSWNGVQFGMGLAAVLGGGALGVKVKESSEPKAGG